MIKNVNLNDDAYEALANMVGPKKLKVFLEKSKCKTVKDVCAYPIEKITEINGLGLVFQINLQRALKDIFQLDITLSKFSKNEYSLIKEEIIKFFQSFCNGNFGRDWFDITDFTQNDFIYRFKKNRLVKRSLTRAYTDEFLTCIFDKLLKEKIILIKESKPNEIINSLTYYQCQKDLNKLNETEHSNAQHYELNPKFGVISFKLDETYYNKKQYLKNLNEFDKLNSFDLLERVSNKIIFKSLTTRITKILYENYILHYIDLILLNKSVLYQMFSKSEYEILLAHLDKLGLSFDLKFSKDQILNITNIIKNNEKDEIKCIDFLWELFHIPVIAVNNLTYMTSSWWHNFDYANKAIKNSILNDYVKWVRKNQIIFNDNILDNIDNLLFLNRIDKIIKIKSS